MSTVVVVREFAKLTTSPIVVTLDQATISQSAFDWLCALASRFRKNGAELLQVHDRRYLRLDSFVGVLETPCGTTIEILPKHHGQDDNPHQARRLMRRMIQVAFDLPTRDVGPAAITTFDGPLSEWVVRQFLQLLEHIVKRGIRFDYMRVEEEQRFLRGQLDVVKQLRQPLGRQHYFQIKHDVFLPNRPENRLIKTALDLVCQHVKTSNGWRMAHELQHLLADIPVSIDVEGDFQAWGNERLMAHYWPIRSWCQLIIYGQNPVALRGGWHGRSLLFPMEKLFERFVEAALRRDLTRGVSLTCQTRQEHLCTHQGKGFFQLRPDFLLRKGENMWVLDAKWKRLDINADRYGLSQPDFYQLFAYGHKYLRDSVQQELVLIYPMTGTFSQALPFFSFHEQMKMWVIPFDLGDGFGSERLCTHPDMSFNQALTRSLNAA